MTGGLLVPSRRGGGAMFCKNFNHQEVEACASTDASTISLVLHNQEEPFGPAINGRCSSHGSNAEAITLVAKVEALARAWLSNDWERVHQLSPVAVGLSVSGVKLNVATLASALAPSGVPESTLRRVFREAGRSETPGMLLTRLRVTIAAELLADRKLTISAISRQMHFEDTRAFARRFAAWPDHRGLNPREYRAWLGATPERRHVIETRVRARFQKTDKS